MVKNFVFTKIFSTSTDKADRTGGPLHSVQSHRSVHTRTTQLQRTASLNLSDLSVTCLLGISPLYVTHSIARMTAKHAINERPMALVSDIESLHSSAYGSSSTSARLAAANCASIWSGSSSASSSAFSDCSLASSSTALAALRRSAAEGM